MLEEGVGDHGHQGVTVKPMPGPSLEVIKPKLFLELLMGLFADPARLDGAGERLDDHPATKEQGNGEAIQSEAAA